MWKQQCYQLLDVDSLLFFFVCCYSAMPSKYIDEHCFNVLKYIKKNFNISISVYFKCSADDNTKKSSKESTLQLLHLISVLNCLCGNLHLTFATMLILNLLHN